MGCLSRALVGITCFLQVRRKVQQLTAAASLSCCCCWSAACAVPAAGPHCLQLSYTASSTTQQPSLPALGTTPCRAPPPDRLAFLTFATRCFPYCFCCSNHLLSHTFGTCKLHHNLQLACATAIIVITAMKLYNVNILWDSNTWNVDVLNTCLLGKMDNGGNLCFLAFGASGVCVLATFALSLLLCCTCNLCGLGGILDAAFASAGAVVMGVSGRIFYTYHNRPAMQLVPREEWRLSIPILCFCACGLFSVMALAAIWSILSACCCGGCCGGGRSSRTKVVYRDVEKGRGQFMAR